MTQTLAIVIEDYVAGGSCVIANQLARHLNEWNVVLFVNEGFDDRKLLAGLDPQRVRLFRYRLKTLADLGAIPNALNKRGRKVEALLWRVLNLVLRYPHVAVSTLYLSRLFGRSGVDFVISSNGGYPGGEMCRAAVFAAKLRGLKALMIVHSLPMRARRVLAPAEKVMDWLVGRSAAIVCVSRAVADRLSEMRALGVRPVVIENAVEGPKTRTAPAAAAVAGILCAGAFSPVKDQIKAVAIYRRLVERLNADRPDLPVPSLTMMGPTGDEEYLAELRRTIEQNAVPNERIVVLGFVDMAEYFVRPGQVLLISSEREGLPLVLLEAMSYGIPAVATDVGGIGDVVKNGVTGEVRAVDDIDGLAAALWAYVTDGVAYAKASAESARRFEERYSIDNWVGSYRTQIALCEAR